MKVKQFYSYEPDADEGMVSPETHTWYIHIQKLDGEIAICKTTYENWLNLHSGSTLR